MGTPCIEETGLKMQPTDINTHFDEFLQPQQPEAEIAIEAQEPKQLLTNSLSISS